MRATIKDIAREAGVSNSLVSIYLNKRPLASKIAKATKARIDEAVRRLNYRPSVTALALKKGKSRTFGLVLGNICDDYCSFFAQALLDECSKYNYQLIFSITHFNPEEEKRCLENLIARQTDGIFYSLGIFPADYLKSVGLNDYPILQMQSSHPDFNSVELALEEPLKQIAQKIYRLKCRKIVIAHQSWADILEKEIGKLGIEVICGRRETSKDDFHWLNELSPDAVLADSSIYIKYLRRYCRTHGIPVPYLFYSYSLPCDFIDDPRVILVTVSDHKSRLSGLVRLMVDMQEKTDREVFHVKYPVRCLNLEELREYRKEQLADSYYEPFVLKLKYEGEVE